MICMNVLVLYLSYNLCVCARVRVCAHVSMNMCTTAFASFFTNLSRRDPLHLFIYVISYRGAYLLKQQSETKYSL